MIQIINDNVVAFTKAFQHTVKLIPGLNVENYKEICNDNMHECVIVTETIFKTGSGQRYQVRIQQLEDESASC